MIRLALPLLLIAASPALGASCLPRDAATEQLSQRYDEQPVARGLRANGTMAELWLSPKGSWTLLVTLPDGLSCILDGGTDMDMRPPMRGQPG